MKNIFKIFSGIFIQSCQGEEVCDLANRVLNLWRRAGTNNEDQEARGGDKIQSWDWAHVHDWWQNKLVGCLINATFICKTEKIMKNIRKYMNFLVNQQLMERRFKHVFGKYEVKRLSQLFHVVSHRQCPEFYFLFLLQFCLLWGLRIRSCANITLHSFTI